MLAVTDDQIGQLCPEPIDFLATSSKLQARMVNYHNPQTIVRYLSARINLHHVFFGILFWELVTSLDYEWDVIRGRRPYRRTIWIYTVARVTALACMATEFIESDGRPRINCAVWGKAGLALPNIAFASAALLIVLRIMAIWSTKKIIVLMAMAVWVTDAGFLINGVVRVRAAWSNELNICILLNPGGIKSSIMGSLIADVVLLFIMLIGLLRIRFGAGNSRGLERVLWNQGVIWLLIAIVCEIPPTVFIYLNLNEPLSFMFQPPNTIVMTISATRMYRSLMKMGSSEVEISQASARNTRRTIPNMQFQAESIPLSRMESVHAEMDLSSKSQMAGSSSHIGADRHAHYEKRELKDNTDTESDSGK